jgi:hypothetical protein
MIGQRAFSKQFMSIFPCSPSRFAFCSLLMVTIAARILSRLPLLFVFCLMLLVTILISAKVWRVHDCKHWPTTKGTVIAFRETPNYKYFVGEKSYTNSIVSCNEVIDSYMSLRNSPGYAVRFPLQAGVVVHYRPSDPALSVLETDLNYKMVAVVMFGLVLMTGLCGVFLLV